MVGSKISYNIHAQMVKDSTRLKNHLLKIQPAAVLVLDGLGLAQEIKASLPNTLVIHRNYGITKGDDDIHKRVTPEQWLDLRAKESEGGVFLYTTNEPGFTQEAIDWHTHLMELAAACGVRLVVGNFGVGTPGADDWGQAQRMLELLDQHRDLFILGLHEYACGIITSGLYGGYPDNAGVQPGTPGGQNLIPKDKWPADVSTVTMFHMGRFKFLVKYCQQHGLNPPRIILTEHGMDDVSDIKPWADKLLKTPPYTSIRGWDSLWNQWKAWFNPIGWSVERAYFEQLAWADRVIYHNSPVEAQLIYCWAHSSEDWEQFDVAEAGEFQSLLETYAGQSGPAPVITQPVGVPVPPPTVPAPPAAASSLPAFPPDFATRAIKARFTSRPPSVNIREMPSAKALAVSLLMKTPQSGYYIPAEELLPNERVDETIGTVSGTWLPISFNEVRGWVFSPYLYAVEVNRIDRQRVHNMTASIRTMLDDLDKLIGD